MSKNNKKIRGVFERVQGSGIWWIQYFDGGSSPPRRRQATKGNAIKLYQKRKKEALQGKKLPESPDGARRRSAKSERPLLSTRWPEKASHSQDEIRMTPILEQFGERAAESIRPEELERWLNDEAEERRWAPATREPICCLVEADLSSCGEERQSQIQSGPAAKDAQRE